MLPTKVQHLGQRCLHFSTVVPHARQPSPNARVANDFRGPVRGVSQQREPVAGFPDGKRLTAG